MSADDAIYQIKYRRLQELRKQAAYAGPASEPSLTLQIEDLQRELQQSSPEPPTMNATPSFYLPEGTRLGMLEKVVETIRNQLFWMALGIVSIGVTSLVLSIVALILVVQR